MSSELRSELLSSLSEDSYAEKVSLRSEKSRLSEVDEVDELASSDSVPDEVEVEMRDPSPERELRCADKSENERDEPEKVDGQHHRRGYRHLSLACILR